MSFLVDTCVLSEWKRRVPDAAVLRWLGALDASEIHISVLSIGELRKGILRLPEGRRRSALVGWLRELRLAFGANVLPISHAEVEAWAELNARAEAAGRSLPAIDGLIAATAAAHHLTVATRNTDHMAASGVPLFNPWTGERLGGGN